MPMIKFCVQLAWYQISKGRYFIMEHPAASQMWSLPDLLALAKATGVSWNNLDMCAYGMKDPETGKHFLKNVCLMKVTFSDFLY